MMKSRNTIISSDIEYGRRHQEIEIPLNVPEMFALERIKKILDSRDEARIISLVKYQEKFKVVSCRRFKGEKANDDPADFFIKNYLQDYVSYLDYLYLNGVENVDEMPLPLESFETIIKAIVSYYDVSIDARDWINLVKITDLANGNMFFYSMETVRPTFDVELLKKVREDLKRKFLSARNKPGIDEIAKLLKNHPRPSMTVNYND